MTGKAFCGCCVHMSKEKIGYCTKKVTSVHVAGNWLLPAKNHIKFGNCIELNKNNNCDSYEPMGAII